MGSFFMPKIKEENLFYEKIIQTRAGDVDVAGFFIALTIGVNKCQCNGFIQKIRCFMGPYAYR